MVAAGFSFGGGCLGFGGIRWLQQWLFWWFGGEKRCAVLCCGGGSGMCGG
jgi:hypothetical protein